MNQDQRKTSNAAIKELWQGIDAGRAAHQQVEVREYGEGEAYDGDTLTENILVVKIYDGIAGPVEYRAIADAITSTTP